MAGNAPALQAVVMGTCGRWSVPREGSWTELPGLYGAIFGSGLVFTIWKIPVVTGSRREMVPREERGPAKRLRATPREDRATQGWLTMGDDGGWATAATEPEVT